jgi:ABC-type multidrug transport system fused ATPase/permease subunit
LDTVTESSIQEALHALGQYRTVIVIAHRLSTIRHADQILVMKQGRIVERGTHKDLLKQGDGEYTKLWSTQNT